uniref:Nodulation protein NfeD n=1 Tax=Ignisphaera aggregans TaxID=334771 RepID=A0A7C2ZR47_9CREN
MKNSRAFFLSLIFVVLTILSMLLLYPGALPRVIGSDGVNNYALLIRIEGYTSLIDTPVQEYVANAIKTAEDRRVPLVIHLDTYGGYLDPALNIANMLLESKVPVIVYVHSKAYSAGTLIAMASHIIAMRNSAVIGAVQPVSINPLTGEVVFINETKVVNPIIKTLELCAEQRNRNISLVRRFVYENLVLSGSDAIRLNIANYIVESLDDLLETIQGVKVNISGTTWILKIDRFEYLAPTIDIYVEILLRNSIVNSILFFIGLFGTLALITSGKLELLPLTLIPLLLSLVDSDLGGNIISMALIALGAILLFIEIFVLPGFGVIGASGIVALIAGMLLLPLPMFSYYVDIVTLWRAIAVLASTLGGLFIVVIYKSFKAIRSPKRVSYSPDKAITGRAVDRLAPGKKGYVMIDGELWEAESDDIIESGEEVEIVERKRTPS